MSARRLNKSPQNKSTLVWLPPFFFDPAPYQPLLMTFHHLLTRPRHREPGLISEVAAEGGVSEVGDVGGAREENSEFLQLWGDSIEREAGLTFDVPDQGLHENEAGLELGL